MRKYAFSVFVGVICSAIAGCEGCNDVSPWPGIPSATDGGPSSSTANNGGGYECEPARCEDIGIGCGLAADGCGDLLECGACDAPSVCGGGSTPSQCGYAPPACERRTCADYAANCGYVADGCGDVIDCGDCSDTAQVCGGGGVPNQCGGPVQSADNCPALQSCSSQNATCGLAGNGCGGTLDCGACSAPETCGGGGVPSQCGFRNPAAGVNCGDGSLDLGETCDDGNTRSGDGCTGDCLSVEPGYACLSAGLPCESTVQCGDGFIGGSETCDDQNQISGDGCNQNCQLESGYHCPIVGAACRALRCGDGIRAGFEECDDGNARSADGCSGSCLLERGFQCDTPGQACTRTTCGNGIREGAEDCDDGNYDTGDGCSPLCTFEPVCQNGLCEERCGDGIRLGAEGCDDGNTRDGDGCSATCTVEAGFQCSENSEEPVLPVVYRDFIGTRANGVDEGRPEDIGPIHRDFEKYPDERHITDPNQRTYRCNLQVQATLDEQGKPVVVDRGGCVEPVYTQGDDDPSNDIDPFGQWYRSDTSVNRTVVDELVVTSVAGQAGAYQYFDDFFFPLTGRGFQDPSCLSAGGACEQPRLDRRNDDTGRAAQPQNFHFTSETRYWFTYRGGERLTFDGDDDVWVYIDGKLAVDINGMHPAISRWIQLPDPDDIDANAPAAGARGSSDPAYDNPELIAKYCELQNAQACNARDAQRYVTEPTTLGLEPGRIYEVAVFHAERHVDQSQYRLTLQNFLSARSVCTWTCGDGVATRFEVCDDGAANNTGAYGSCASNCLATGPRCGDGVVQSQYEQCDDGVNTTVYLTTDSPVGACAPNCQLPVALTSCSPTTCANESANCGVIADGCGGLLECGNCAAEEYCGGDGTPNQCAPSSCQPLTCSAAGAACGSIGDGCGGELDCGVCDAGEVCGATNAPNQCIPLCTPRTCENVNAECGVISDGCGDVLDCGICTAPAMCGVNAPANRCGFPSDG